jgi:hypothetical protein
VPLPTTSRGGPYYRVYNPAWADPPDDTSYSKSAGGRWNARGAFGALYLNATVLVAAAQARFQHNNRALKLFDLQPHARPMLATFDVDETVVVDDVDATGVRALRLPASFPFAVDHEPCRKIAQRAHAAGIAGVAARSNAEATATTTVGEELALFDTHPLPKQVGQGVAFADWYPAPIPS